MSLSKFLTGFEILTIIPVTQALIFEITYNLQAMRYVLIIILILIYRYSFANNQCSYFFEYNPARAETPLRHMGFAEKTFSKISAAKKVSELADTLLQKETQLEITLLYNLLKLQHETSAPEHKADLYNARTTVFQLKRALEDYEFASNARDRSMTAYKLPKDIRAKIELGEFHARRNFEDFLTEQGWANGVAISGLKSLLFKLSKIIPELSEDTIVRFITNEIDSFIKHSISNIKYELKQSEYSFESIFELLSGIISSVDFILLTTLSSNDIFKFHRINPVKLSEADRALYLQYRTNEYSQFRLSLNGKLEISTMDLLKLVRFVSEVQQLMEQFYTIEAMAQEAIYFKKESNMELARTYIDNLLNPKTKENFNIVTSVLRLLSELEQQQALEGFKDGLQPKLVYTKESQLSLDL